MFIHEVFSPAILRRILTRLDGWVTDMNIGFSLPSRQGRQGNGYPGPGKWLPLFLIHTSTLQASVLITDGVRGKKRGEGWRAETDSVVANIKVLSKGDPHFSCVVSTTCHLATCGLAYAAVYTKELIVKENLVVCIVWIVIYIVVYISFTRYFLYSKVV